MRVLTFIITLTLSVSLWAQADASTPEIRPWYSVYLNKKINYRWSVDSFTLLAMRSMRQDFWLTQFSFGANYRIDRFWSVTFNYGHTRYRHSGAWWYRNYPELSPGVFNSVGFHALGVTLRRTDRIHEYVRMTNRLAVMKYFPRYQKFGTRVQLTSQLSYAKRDLPYGIKPFISGALYYYMGGVPAEYYTEASEFIEEVAPNGLHRYRIRIGANFRPISDNRKLSMNIYYALNREINGIGNDLNFLTLSSTDNLVTTYRFNNYNILGVQVNYFL